jgi:hypothetical protein
MTNSSSTKLNTNGMIAKFYKSWSNPIRRY